MNVRLADLSLQKTGACYAIDPACLGRFKLPDIQRCASRASIQGLFPDLDDHFSSHVDGMQSLSALEVRGHAYEDLRGLEAQFRQVQAAIAAQRCIRVSY